MDNRKLYKSTNQTAVNKNHIDEILAWVPRNLLPSSGLSTVHIKQPMLLLCGSNLF